MSRNAVDYEILTSGNTEELAAKVAGSLFGGWELSGSMVVIVEHTGFVSVCQPIVKYAEEEDG